MWAYVHVGTHGDNQHTEEAEKRLLEKPYTPRTFAALKLAGLCSKNSVQAHWQRWQDAIDSGPDQAR